MKRILNRFLHYGKIINKFFDPVGKMQDFIVEISD